MSHCDILIVGAGIAGASLAAELAGRRSVVLLESEDLPGRHATGRSAAFFAETYGGPDIQPLTAASRAFFEAPPDGFTEATLLGPRGALHVAASEATETLAALERDFASQPGIFESLPTGEAGRRVPILKEDRNGRALWEAGCRDIDVAALHAGYLRSAKRKGATLVTDAEFLSARREGGRWQVESRAGKHGAEILVDAAGAWADEVARRAGVQPVGIQPYRRTMVVADIDRPVDPAWPLVVDAEGKFYFKPDAGRLWISPHDEAPQPAGDAQPAEIDVAITVDRFERATTAKVTRLERTWAGLRSFAPDRLPVLGFDPDADGFFWCAGQGGFGIQTAPASARLCAALILGDGPIPEGTDPQRYAAARLR